MLITDEIKAIEWYDMKLPLETKLMKQFDEYLALAVLRYCFPEKYNCFKKADSPDLQSEDGKCGVEVTLAANETMSSIEMNYVRYRLPAFAKKRDELKEKIERDGAKLDSTGLMYPVSNSTQDKEAIRSVIAKKCKKLDTYANNGFERMELFIRLNSPPCILEKDTFVELFSQAHGYKTVYFSAPSGLMSYCLSKNSLNQIKIPREDYSALNAIARLTVDGKIALDSPIWTEYKENQYAHS